MSKYYKAGTKVAALCVAILDSQTAMLTAAAKVARKHLGASRVDFYTAKGFRGDLRVSALVFKDESKVDTAIFCRLQGTKDGWRPRLSNKAGKALGAELDACRSLDYVELMRETGLEFFVRAHRGGGVFGKPGIHKIGKSVFLEVRGDEHPKGCTRVSDVEYERLRKKVA